MRTKSSTNRSELAVVNPTTGRASCTMRCKREKVLPMRAGSSPYAGTATAPRYKQPKTPETNSGPEEPSRSTRSPAAEAALSHTAIARARRSSSAYVNLASSLSPPGKKA